MIYTILAGAIGGVTGALVFLLLYLCIIRHREKNGPSLLHLLTEEEKNSEYHIQKLYVWEQEYSSTVGWDDFNEEYTCCSYCGEWSTSQCICYARN